ncbi:MAG TPA: decaprenyl-phosphate phosphoribosyltransferase [Thermoanaerobaculia bacterium]|nr:decaprenyl-phosphate phosphoribosyltransferase [Thermoanaerobaculia bacterium]
MLPPLLRSLRPAQWAKNLFVLPPLVFSGSLQDPVAVVRIGLTFLLFCGLSSSIYLLNDLVDRQRDRLHPLKRHRPLAAGTLSVPVAVATLVVLAVGGLIGAALLDPGVLAASGAFLLLNLLYSAWLKHVVIVDVMSIAAGYVLRVLAGGAAIMVPVSQWLLLCATFLALFLAFSKRRHELELLRGEAAGQREVLLHYGREFLDQMINVVTASTVIAYALYTTDAETTGKYGSPYYALTIPFALFGIFRYLYLTYQADDPRNPTETMLTDVPFLVNLVLWGSTVLAIIYT